jgi:hypothetical protein
VCNSNGEGAPNFLLITLSSKFSEKFENKTTSGFRLLKIIKELVPGVGGGLLGEN